jgi:hypothetical protein
VNELPNYLVERLGAHGFSVSKPKPMEGKSRYIIGHQRSRGAAMLTFFSTGRIVIQSSSKNFKKAVSQVINQRQLDGAWEMDHKDP